MIDMFRQHGVGVSGIVSLLCVALSGTARSGDAPLPPGVKTVWDLDKAFREKTPTHERICINELWRWQPARNAQGLVTTDSPLTGGISVPDDRWGYFKVPGNFAEPIQMKVFAHPSWSIAPLKALCAAWHQREITIPPEWAGRRISIAVEYLNSLGKE
jgi:beta-galactosidase